MALYDRNYANERQAAQGYTQESAYESQSAQGLRAFVKQTYQLFAASLLAGTVGAYVGIGIAQTVTSWFWGFVILEFALLFGVYMTKRQAGINLLMLFGFTFVSGLTLAPILSHYLGAGMGGVIANAFLLTTVAFGGLSLFAMNTTKDFSSMGKMLFIALIVLVVGSLINIFLGSPLLQVAIAGVGAILFSAFILYDTQNIIKGAYETPVEGAIALYLDFFNLFVSLLQILGIFGSDE